MGRPSDAREVLIAEALGDFATLLARIDAVKPTLEKSCSDLNLTADRLLDNIEPFQKRIVEMAFDTQNRANTHIAEQANRVMRKTAVEQIAAMQESARRIFKDEVIPPLRQVAGELRQARLRTHPAWATWLTHSAAAVMGAWCAGVLLMYLVPVKAPETQQSLAPPLRAAWRRRQAPGNPRARR
jgi:hypothetical protein